MTLVAQNSLGSNAALDASSIQLWYDSIMTERKAVKRAVSQTSGVK